MSTTYTGMAAGSLKRTTYNNFRGVDFTGGEVNDSRSPDALNMWKNYRLLGKMISTRPGISQLVELDGDVFGQFFYEVNSVPHLIIHAGVKLYDYNLTTGNKTTLKANGMKPARSVGFVFNNILFIKDGLSYYEYNGTTLSVVDGYIPNIAIHNLISGKTEMIQEANLLTDYVKEQYIPDGTATNFYLSQKEINDGLEVWDISGTTPVQILTGFTIDKTNGEVEFSTPPSAATTATIEFKYSKTSDGRATADKCKLACVFDNRVFMSGNENHPNLLVWSGLNNPRYIANTSYSTLGNDAAQVKALVPGNNALWSFKEPSHSNTTIFYSVPYEVYDEKLGQTIKTYSTSHSSISTGCRYGGINFNDDIVFLSEQGLEGISSNITTEQVIAHRSSLVDSKLLQTIDKPLLVEWDGYLLICCGHFIFLADSRQKVVNGEHVEYEWFYWDLGVYVESAVVINNTLYIGTKAGAAVDKRGYEIYTRTGYPTYYLDTLTGYLYDEEKRVDYPDGFITYWSTTNLAPKIYYMTYDGYTDLYSYWTTKQDDLGYPQLLKTTNKKGFVTDVDGQQVSILTRLDNNDFEHLTTLTNTKGYVVTKIKKKKWKTIQIKFESESPFGIYETTLESYIGSYVKRS